MEARRQRGGQERFEEVFLPSLLSRVVWKLLPEQCEPLEPSPTLALPFPTAAAKVCPKAGRSGTLEPEVKDKREEKNGLQARGRNRGNRALIGMKGLYLPALQQNTQNPEKRLWQVSGGAMRETANP